MYKILPVSCSVLLDIFLVIYFQITGMTVRLQIFIYEMSIVKATLTRFLVFMSLGKS